jgi:nitronate monooxygenase
VAVWLFAPRPGDVAGGDVARVVAALRGEGFVVVWQVGSVKAAGEAVFPFGFGSGSSVGGGGGKGEGNKGADVLVVQGVDAGGHQFAGGAGVVSLVPEVGDMLEREGRGGGEVVVVAAGGIVDGRGVAAALALGGFRSFSLSLSVSLFLSLPRVSGAA